MPTRHTGCSNDRPCPSGQYCNPATAICESAEPQPDLSVIADLTELPDLSSPPDLTVPPPGMMYVPGGTFLMGSNTAGKPEEGPIHPQTVSPFYVDITLVTASAYLQCVSLAKCSIPQTGGTCTYGISGKENHPINCADWNQSGQYCAANGKRLLSEIEFEYITRGSSSAEYSWGNAAPSNQLCWNSINTCAVDSFPRTVFGMPTSFGLSDLAGNVSEWTSSQFCDYPLTATGGVNCQAGQVALRSSTHSRTLASDVRAAIRSSQGMGTNSYDIGFRCAKSIN